MVMGIPYSKKFLGVKNFVDCIMLRGRYSLFKIIFGGVIIVLGNKSITTRSFTLLSVSVMI